MYSVRVEGRLKVLHEGDNGKSIFSRELSVRHLDGRLFCHAVEFVPYVFILPFQLLKKCGTGCS